MVTTPDSGYRVDGSARWIGRCPFALRMISDENRVRLQFPLEISRVSVFRGIRYARLFECPDP